MSGGIPLSIAVCVFAHALPVIRSPQNRIAQDWRQHTAIVTALSTLVLGSLFAHYDHQSDTEQFGNLPTGQNVVQKVDEYWPNGRILVNGTRAPAYYHATTPNRFVLRLTYNHEDFVWMMSRAEQFSLLIPPADNQHFKPLLTNSALEKIRKQGSRELILRHEWPSGWQLWRSIIPPESP
jgi:hypothetical protein